MRQRFFLLIGLLVCLGVSSALAQIPEGQFQEFQPLPFAVDSPPVANLPSTAELQSAVDFQPAVGLQPAEAEPSQDGSGDAATTDLPLEIGPAIDLVKPDPLEGFLGYRYESNSLEWILGNDDQFGMFSLKSDHYQSPGVNHGIGIGLQFHFLNGPVSTDMPPRVYDFSIGYQHRDRVGAFGYDVAIAVMASSDFEGSSREGIRLPGHAVGFLFMGSNVQLVFGVDYLDRGDIKLLPVAGLVMFPCRDVRLEAVFPRPRVTFQLNDKYQLYVGGELGGGTWAIERTTLVDDLATYRDLRLCVGLQHVEEGNARSAIEIGYLFGRRLEYASGNGNLHLDDTAMIRLVRTY